MQIYSEAAYLNKPYIGFLLMFLSIFASLASLASPPLVYLR
jgi:hypothetical protein